MKYICTWGNVYIHYSRYFGKTLTRQGGWLEKQRWVCLLKKYILVHLSLFDNSFSAYVSYGKIYFFVKWLIIIIKHTPSHFFIFIWAYLVSYYIISFCRKEAKLNYEFMLIEFDDRNRTALLYYAQKVRIQKFDMDLHEKSL